LQFIICVNRRLDEEIDNDENYENTDNPLNNMDIHSSDYSSDYSSEYSDYTENYDQDLEMTTTREFKPDADTDDENYTHELHDMI
jgi:hypothetical protein